jgi:hypothetical protein
MRPYLRSIRYWMKLQGARSPAQFSTLSETALRFHLHFTFVITIEIANFERLLLNAELYEQNDHV